MVSYAKRVIPEGAQTWWREYRQAAKDVKRERTGEEDEAEVLVHGVEEADQRTKQEGASEYTRQIMCLGLSTMLTMKPPQAWPRNWRSRTPSTRASSSSVCPSQLPSPPRWSRYCGGGAGRLARSRPSGEVDAADPSHVALHIYRLRSAARVSW